MASQTAILLLADLAKGESGVLGYANWGEAADDNFQKLEDTVGEVTSKSLSGSDVTLTAAEERSLVIKLTGTLSANVAVKTNDRKGFWIVHNGTSGSYTVTFKTDSGSGVVVPQGGKMLLYSDGTDVLPLTGDQVPSDLFRVVDTTDRTKKLDFDISGFTTATSRTVTLPDQDLTITAAAAGVLDDATVAAMVKSLGVGKYVTKSANYTAVLADLGSFFHFTAAATLSLTAVATLGADWWCVVQADGDDITVDPNSTEQINGSATLTVSDGTSAFIYCTGAAFRAIVVASGDVTTDGTQTLTNKTLTNPVIAQINDANGNEALLLPATASAVNEATIANAATGNAPKISATGDDTNIGLELEPKGTGVVEINSPKITVGSDAEGDAFYRDSNGNVARLGIGTAGQVLTVNSGATAPEWADAAGATLETAQATTSGSSKDFTSIPSGVNRIDVLLDQVKTDGSTNDPIIRIGDSGGIESTGYDSGDSTGFEIGLSDGTSAFSGIVTLMRISGNIWVASGLGYENSSGTRTVGGKKELSAELTTVRLATTGGALNGGQVNISYS